MAKFAIGTSKRRICRKTAEESDLSHYKTSASYLRDCLRYIVAAVVAQRRKLAEPVRRYIRKLKTTTVRLRDECSAKSVRTCDLKVWWSCRALNRAYVTDSSILAASILLSCDMAKFAVGTHQWRVYMIVIVRKLIALDRTEKPCTGRIVWVAQPRLRSRTGALESSKAVRATADGERHHGVHVASPLGIGKDKKKKREKEK